MPEWRTAKFPKPEKRGPKPRKPIARTTRPRNRVPSAIGDHRARVKYANDLWRHLVYAKEPDGICPGCRKRRWHDAAHGFIKGKYFHVRFELDNGIPLCRPCHRSVDSDHAAKEALWRRYLGNEKYETLSLRAQAKGKCDMIVTTLWLEAETRQTRERIERWGFEWPIKPSGAKA